MRISSQGTPRLRLLLAVTAVAIGASALWSTTAGAAFHLMKVREVYPGPADDSYVVLQMLQPGEGFVGGHSLRVYDSGGATKHTFTFTAGGGYSSGYSAPNDNHGNNTILVGDTGVEASFGVTPDDHADASLEIPASGGAVCWLDGSPPDCVSWGSFSGTLPHSAGMPAAPIESGRAIRRTISPGCATFLEAGDDGDDGASDFSSVFPDPRPNSEAPSERRCTSSPADPDQTEDDQSPSPSPESRPRAGTAFATRVAPVRGGRALIRLRCRGQQRARCDGALRVIARVRLRRGRRRVARNVVIGRVRYRLPAAGGLRTVRVRLTRRGRTLLRRGGRRGLKTKLVGGDLRSRTLVLRTVRRRGQR